MTARALAQGTQLLYPLGELHFHARPAKRHPAVTVRNHSLQASLGLRAEEDLWATFLDWLGPGPQRPEIDKLAMKLGRILGPYLAHREDALPQDFPALREWGAVVFHLLSIPSTADAENHPAIGERVERGDLLGQ